MTSTLGKPLRPLSVPEESLTQIRFYPTEESLPHELHFPITPELFGIEKDGATVEVNVRKGGETTALLLLNQRLLVERSAFQHGFMLPNQSNPDLVLGVSLSPALRFGEFHIPFLLNVGWGWETTQKWTILNRV